MLDLHKLTILQPEQPAAESRTDLPNAVLAGPQIEMSFEELRFCSVTDAPRQGRDPARAPDASAQRASHVARRESFSRLR